MEIKAPARLIPNSRETRLKHANDRADMGKQRCERSNAEIVPSNYTELIGINSEPRCAKSEVDKNEPKHARDQKVIAIAGIRIRKFVKLWFE